jgi:iron(III) transport system permease protein
MVLLPVAYLTVRNRSAMSGTINTVIVSGFALPGLVIALALVFWVLGTPAVRGLYQTYVLLVFAYVVHFGAQSLRTSQVAVSGLPRAVDDAARSLGAGWMRRFRTVDLPLVLPGVAAGAGLVLLSVMKELPATLLLAPIGFETLATKVWSSAESGLLGQAGVASIALVALSAVLVWLVTIRRMDRLAT